MKERHCFVWEKKKPKWSELIILLIHNLARSTVPTHSNVSSSAHSSSQSREEEQDSKDQDLSLSHIVPWLNKHNLLEPYIPFL